QGYSVYVSEWHPIVRYGIAHDWRRLVRYSPQLDVSTTWGNVIGFREDPGEHLLRSLVQQSLKFSVAVATSKPSLDALRRVETPHAMNVDIARPFYADFGEWLMVRSPKLFRLAQRARRSL